VTKAEYKKFLTICRERGIENHPQRTDFKTGGLVGSVEVVDCVPSSPSYWFHGRYGFVLRHAKPERFRAIKEGLNLLEPEPAFLSQSTVRLPKRSPITEQELEDIKATVRRAESHLLEQNALVAKLQNVLAVKKGHTREQNLAERALLWLEVGQNQSRNLNEPAYKEAILKATERQDHRFFVRLGRILGTKPYTPKHVKEITPPKKLEWFLVRHWAEKRDGLPELFYLTPKGLADVVLHHQKVKVTQDALVKMRQRHGLKPSRRAKLVPEIRGGKLKFPQLDK